MRLMGVATLATAAAVLSCAAGLLLEFTEFNVERLPKIDLRSIGARRPRDLKERIYAVWSGSGTGWHGEHQDYAADCHYLAFYPARR